MNKEQINLSKQCFDYKEYFALFVFLFEVKNSDFPR